MIGIEHFRNLASTGANRVVLGQDKPGSTKQVDKAPISFAGRVVSAIRNHGADPTAHQDPNMRVRTSLFNALIKAYGPDTANAVLQATNFQPISGERLSAKTIKQVLNAADQIKQQNITGNRNAAQAMTGNLINVFTNHAVANNVPPAIFNGPRLAAEFQRAVAQHPEFTQRALTNQELGQIAQETVQRFVAGIEARFTEGFGALAQLSGPPPQIANPPFKEAGQLFTGLQARLGPGGNLHNEPGNFAQHATAGLTAIQTASQLASRTSFDRAQVVQNQHELMNAWAALHQAEASLTNVAVGPLSPDAAAIRAATLAEITAKKNLLENKMLANNEYLRNDPLSEKAAAYNKVTLAQGGAVMINRALAGLNLPLGSQAMMDLVAARNQMVNGATQEWQQARTDVRVTKETVPFRQHKTDITGQLKQAFRTAAQNAPDAETRNALLKMAKDVGKNLKGCRTEALNTMQSWAPFSRQMVVSRDGLTREYRSEIIPASQTGTSVARDYQAAGLQGVGAGTKDDPENARNLQVSKLTDGNGRVVHQSVRHGVLDPWRYGTKAERQQAAQDHAYQVLNLSAETNTPFRNALLANANNPHPPQFTHTHVNFNLTTPVDRIISDYNEGTFTKHQFEGFERNQGQQQYNVLDPVTGNVVQAPPVNVSTITFSFGVNDLAQSPGVLAKPLNAKAWANVYEHDKANLQKLVGDLSPGTTVGGHIGTITDRLEAMANGPPPVAAARELLAKIQEQVDISRQIFTSGDFRRGEGDPYKMVRHAMRVVDLGNEALQLLGDTTNALTQSQGCKSNKDRGGMADVEIKAQAMIEDMGGRVLPNGELSPEDRTIYNIGLTMTGQDWNQSRSTSLPGSKNAKEAAEKINDPFAQEYAMGFEAFVKA